jgi:hypothetical protein
VIGQYPEIKRRIDGVKKARLASKTASVRVMANQPYLFTQIRVAKKSFLAVPRVSSERRQYIPILFLQPNIIPHDGILMIPDVGLYEFGILTSALHNAWMRTVAGRLESRYSYSPNVYQLFPWMTVDAANKLLIERAAQAVLDARNQAFVQDANNTLATLYDPDLMPSILRAAHTKLDKTVDTAYCYQGSTEDNERVAFLFRNDAARKITGIKKQAP